MWITRKIIIDVARGLSKIDEEELFLPNFYLLELILLHILKNIHVALTLI